MEDYIKYIFPIVAAMATFWGSWKISQYQTKELKKTSADHEKRIRDIELDIASRLGRIEEALTTIKDDLKKRG